MKQTPKSIEDEAVKEFVQDCRNFLFEKMGGSFSGETFDAINDFLSEQLAIYLNRDVA